MISLIYEILKNNTKELINKTGTDLDIENKLCLPEGKKEGIN